MSGSQPQLVSETSIYVQRARQIDEHRWQAAAIIIWPDGSCDAGAIGEGQTASEAEKGAENKALDRWDRIELRRTMNKSHDAKDAIHLLIKA